MSVDCSVDNLKEEARCFNCISPSVRMAVKTYLLAVIAGGSLDPQVLMVEAKEFQRIPPGLLNQAEAQGLAQWAEHSSGPSVSVYWIPNTVGCRWVDSGGVHLGADLADFRANADVPTVTSLRVIDLLLTSIGNLDTLPLLNDLDLHDNPLLTSVDLSGCDALVTFTGNASGFLSLDFSNLLLLQTIRCDNSDILTLNCSGCVSLQSIRAQQCELGDVTITGCVSLTTFWVYDNPQNPLNPPLNVIP